MGDQLEEKRGRVLACLILVWFVHGLERVQEHGRGEDMGRACRSDSTRGETEKTVHIRIVQAKLVHLRMCFQLLYLSTRKDRVTSQTEWT